MNTSTASVHRFEQTCIEKEGLADKLAKVLKIDYRDANADKRKKLRRESSVVAGLVLLQAMIFHRLLAQFSGDEFKDELDGRTVADLGGLDKHASPADIRNAWAWIRRVNYHAIFGLADKLMEKCVGIFPDYSTEMFGETADVCVRHTICRTLTSQ